VSDCTCCWPSSTSRAWPARSIAELDRAERQGEPTAEVLQRPAHRASLVPARERRLVLPRGASPAAVAVDARYLPLSPGSPGVDRSQIRALAGMDFVRRAHNLVLIGPTGTGKTGIAIGLLRQACLNGYAGRFYNAQTLFDELYASLADAAPPSCSRRCRACGLSSLTNSATSASSPSRSTPSSDSWSSATDASVPSSRPILTIQAGTKMFGNKPLVDALARPLRHQCHHDPHSTGRRCANPCRRPNPHHHLQPPPHPSRWPSAPKKHPPKPA